MGKTNCETGNYLTMLQLGSELGKHVSGTGKSFLWKNLLGENQTHSCPNKQLFHVYDIEASDKEERDQIVELLLVNFPVMRATRRHGRSRSLHDFLGGITAGQEKPSIRFVNDCD